VSIGGAPGIIVGVAVGAAAKAGLDPAFEVPIQDAWAANPNKILDIGLLARLVAQGGVLLGAADGSTDGSAYNHALRQGFTGDKLDRLIYLSQTAPDLALTLELWRRGLLGDPTGATAVELVKHAFAKHQIEPQYWPALEELFSGRLDPALLAVMVQRSVLANASNAAGTDTLLPFDVAAAAQAIYNEWNAVTEAQLGTAAPDGHNVTPMPQVPIDPIIEARAHGIDFERLAAEARIVGLPASPDLAARMVFRGIITPSDFAQAAAEGNTRIEWAPALFEGFREIPTTGEYITGQLRGRYDRAGRLANTIKHGMSEENSDLLYDVHARGLPLHQAFIGERRGGTYDGPIEGIPDWAQAAMRKASLDPVYWNLAWAARESYPSAFVTRALLQAGAITEKQGEQIFSDIGWPDWLGTTVAQHYAPSGVTGADKHVTAAQTQLRNTIHTSYKSGEIDAAAATAALPTAGVATDWIPAILAIWDVERSIPRKTLTAAQIKKGYNEAAINADTGAAWTKDEAIAALIALGYAADTANDFLVI
jgi:hypothetical protein